MLEIISSIFFQPQQHEARNNCRNHKHVNNQWITEEIRGKPIDKWKHDNPTTIGCNKSSSKMEIYSDTNIPQETTISKKNQPLSFHLNHKYQYRDGIETKKKKRSNVKPGSLKR